MLKGRTDIGMVVASLTGPTRIEGPWRDLVSFFRTVSTVRVKHDMLIDALAARGPSQAWMRQTTKVIGRYVYPQLGSIFL